MSLIERNSAVFYKATTEDIQYQTFRQIYIKIKHQKLLRTVDFTDFLV